MQTHKTMTERTKISSILNDSPSVELLRLRNRELVFDFFLTTFNKDRNSISFENILLLLSDFLSHHNISLEDNSALVGIGVNYDSELRSNNNYLYHISISKNISSSQLQSIINYIKNFPSTYNVNNYACADFAINIGNLAGMNLPSTTMNELTFSGRSPGQLGQEIRSRNSNSTTTISKNKSKSPESQGKCN